jgi:pimeloyl-ACP methyl ester carboxylesterase
MTAGRPLLHGEAAPLDAGSVALADGRRVAWTAWGARDGTTVVGQSHLGVAGDRALAVDVTPVADAGIRLVFVTRAGLPGSSPRPGRTEQTDAEDLLAVADALGLERIRLLGECGGTGSVLAVAARWPERVIAVGLVSAMAPLRGPDADSYLSGHLRAWRRVMRFGVVARWVAGHQIAATRRDPDRAIEESWKTLAEVDRALAADPDRRALAREVMVSAFESPEVAVDEWRAAIGPWSVDLSAIAAPVLIDHGELDRTAPVGMARWLSRRLPTAELRIDPARGHFQTPEQSASLLAALIAR